MPQSIEEQIKHGRALVVAEAHKWLGTPYVHEASVLGAGVDCAMILREVYEKCLPYLGHIEIEHYPPDWHLHRGDERYLNIVRKYADEVEHPLPGDIAVIH